MKHVGIIITPSYFNSSVYGLLLTEELSIAPFKLPENMSFKQLDIVVYEECNSEIVNVRKIKFEFGSKEWMYYNYFRNNRPMQSFIQGDLSLYEVSLKYHIDFSSDDNEWVSAYKNGILECNHIALNNEIALQNNYKGESVIISNPRVILLLKLFIINPLYKEWTYGYSGIEKMYELYNFIKDFNEAEVFESYRIEIKSHTICKVGGDDRYYEDKVYSISYIDDYLKKWFKQCSINLYRDSGYTSRFETVNPYQRFLEEENIAKEQAYKEYNREEHLQCLIKPYIQGLLNLENERTDSIGFEDNFLDFMEKYWRIKEVYDFLYTSYKKTFSNVGHIVYEQCVKNFFKDLCSFKSN